MAGTKGKTSNDLIEELVRESFGFDFFRSVRFVQSARPDLPPIGYSNSPAHDPIRFCQNPTLAFSPHTIEAARLQGGILKMYVQFFGLFGPNGPLPRHLTEYARDRRRHSKDETLTGFLNVFHHRMISFFFRAWADSQLALDLDRQGDQRFPIYVGSFLGIGMPSLQNVDQVPDAAKLYFAGRLASSARNAEGLQAILQEFFGIKTEILSFMGRWFDLPADCVCQLGKSPLTGSLGSSTIVGSRFWDCQLSFRIKFGPVDLSDLERLLPDKPAFVTLRDWVRNYIGQEFLWDVQFVLRASQVPQVCLGKTGRLGWTSWLRAAPFKADADDLILNQIEP
jgi:type VI secretion system protein ImpH